MEKSTNTNNTIKVALIKAGGTGIAEVGETFEKILNFVADFYKMELVVKCFSYTPKTFHELKEHPAQKSAIEDREVEDLVAFCLDAYNEGYHTLFQTATNAGTLYKQRMLTEMVKIMPIETTNGNILMFREQSQGYYAIDAKTETDEYIEITSSYSKEKLFRALDAAFEHARAYFNNEVFVTRIVYKFHIIDKFESWVRQYIEDHGLQKTDIELVQPDSGYDYIMRKIKRSGKPTEKTNLLCVVANEIGDIFTEALPNHYEVGDKATMYAVNTSLAPHTYGQTVVQTIHGSTDAIAGKNILNPFATIRAAAFVLAKETQRKDICNIVEQAINAAMKDGYVTPDMDGDKNTTEVLDYVLSYWTKHAL